MRILIFLRSVIFFLFLYAFSPLLNAQDTPHSLIPYSFAMNTFINEMITSYHFDRKYVTNILKNAEYLPAVIQTINKPFETKPWNDYRHYFLTTDRINSGSNYFKQHLKTLHNAQLKYGVDPNVVTAIIGIESFYGAQAGKFQELGALATLAFYYPPRAQFFRKELTQYLLLTKQQHLPILKLTGSYAGALGIPQFMPSSYRTYGIDYSKNNSVDLLTNHDDAITSIAYYLKKSKWHQGQPVATRAIVSKAIPEKIISKTGKPNITIAKLAQYGVKTKYHFAPQQKVALIAMHNQQSDEYWIVFPNFSAIMAYNPRTTYALAVYQLSQAIKSHE